jgi:hypothetical protein
MNKISLGNTHMIPELNVLVVGMPNVGKSTLLNALRDVGIPGRAFQFWFLFFGYLFIYYTRAVYA